MNLRYLRGVVLLSILLVVVMACQPDDEIQPATPTPIEPTLADTPSVTPTTSPTANLTPPSPTFPPTPTETLIPTDRPPTITPFPTDTPGPYEHVIQQGDDCISIVYQYGHLSLDVLQEFYRLNNFQNNQCALPGAGGRVFVPRPTSAPITNQGDPNVPIEASATHFEVGVDPQSYVAYSEYCVGEDDTLTSIALKNNMTNQKLCELNPLPDGIDCNGCDFSQSDVGFCPRPPLLNLGQCLRVIGPTPFPTATQPPTGLETPTPTPTHRAPNVVYPVPNSTVNGIIRLQWTSVGLLQADEYYVVNLTDETMGQFFINATKDTSLDIPLEYVPRDGNPHQMVWFVSVQVQTPDGLFSPAGGRTPDYRFTWQ